MKNATDKIEGLLYQQLSLPDTTPAKVAPTKTKALLAKVRALPTTIRATKRVAVKSFSLDSDSVLDLDSEEDNDSTYVQQQQQYALSTNEERRN